MVRAIPSPEEQALVGTDGGDAVALGPTEARVKDARLVTLELADAQRMVHAALPALIGSLQKRVPKACQQEKKRTT